MQEEMNVLIMKMWRVYPKADLNINVEIGSEAGAPLVIMTSRVRIREATSRRLAGRRLATLGWSCKRQLAAAVPVKTKQRPATKIQSAHICIQSSDTAGT